MLFGSDFPLITPDRWLADFAEAPFSDEVRPLVLKENAARLLGLCSIFGTPFLTSEPDGPSVRAIRLSGSRNPARKVEANWRSSG